RFFGRLSRVPRSCSGMVAGGPRRPPQAPREACRAGAGRRGVAEGGGGRPPPGGRGPSWPNSPTPYSLRAGRFSGQLFPDLFSRGQEGPGLTASGPTSNSLRQAQVAERLGDLVLALLHPLVSGRQQPLGLGVLLLARERDAEQRLA